MSKQTDPNRELTRAEKVRDRRLAEQARQKQRPPAESRQSQAHPAAKVKTNAAGNPFARPVNTPRKQSHAVEGPELTKPSVNRRIAIPLNQQGAEIEFSTLPVMHLGWRLLSGVVAAAALVAIIFLLVTTRVQAVQVKGLSPLLSQEIAYYANLTGKPVFLVEPIALKEKITTGFPEIQTVAVEIFLPAEVVITAQARQPQYAWEIDDHIYLIDTAGIFYPAEPGTSTEGLIFIKAEEMPEMKLEFEQSEDIVVEVLEYTGLIINTEPTPEPTFRGSSDMVSPATLHALEQILLYLPANAVLQYDQRHGFGWQDPQGWDVYFGFELEQIDMKIAVYQSIVKSINHQGIDVSLISVEFLHAPYYREE